MQKLKIDKPTFYSALAILLVITIPLILFPDSAGGVIGKLFSFMTGELGFLYIWVGIGAVVFVLWLATSKYGKIKLGDLDDKPQFKTFSWAAMLFCAGVGSGVMYWGVIEWAYYYQSPPLGLPALSWQAAEWGGAYAIFHWGITAWSFYVLPAIPIAYIYHVKKKPVLKVSEVCRGVLGDKVDGPLGTVIDVLIMFGLLGAAGTTLGLATPMISAGITKISGIPESFTMNILVLLAVVGLFSLSAYSGLQKGIKRLSDVNVYLVLGLLGFIFVTGNPSFTIKMATSSFGIMVQNFVRMSTWMDPVLGSHFPEWWTVFYWAWWLVYAPFMGLFIAKISKGRSIRNVIMGTILYGTLGCALFFIVLGNHALHLEINNILPVTTILQEHGAPYAIIEVINSVPFGKFVVGLFCVGAIVFLATTFDSASYALAALTTKEIREDQDPARWNRLFWAFALAVLPMSLILIKGPLSILQTASVLAALPLVFILVIIAISTIKVLKKDERDGILKL